MVGLIADEAREFITIPETAVQPPNASISGLSGNYIEGIATLDNRIVLILDVQDVIGAAPRAAA
jgi:purine-binding chemotaxis protein CheW